MLERVLFLNGTCGAGKTTIGEAVAELLAAAGEAVAFVDLDALSTAWPRSVDDPFNQGIGTKNLVAVAGNFVDAGATTLVVAGVIEDEVDLARYKGALGLPMAVVRLVVPLELIDDRLRSRHGEADRAGLAWHQRRAPELNRILDGSSVPMTVVANTAPVPEVAGAVLAACGWAPGAHG